ncbi:MAG: PAS domain-containing protein [Undibacterium sp.]|nr:PAS domain-containing protein [Undibacterium sp.]
MKNFKIVRLWLFPKYLATVLFVLGTVSSVTLYYWLNAKSQSELEQDFTHKAERITLEIQRRFSVPLYGLNDVKNLFDLQPSLSYAQFLSAVHSRDFATEFPGVRGFGYIEKVNDSDVERYVLKQQQDIAPEYDYRSFDTVQRKEHFLLKYFASSSTEHAVLGTDFSSEPRRFNLVQNALSTGKPSLSELVYSAPKKLKKLGVLLMLPVYQKNAPITTSNQGKPALLGLVYTSILLSDLLEQVPGGEQAEVVYQLSNPSANIDGEQLIFYSAPNLSAQARKTPAQFTLVKNIHLYGRDFRLEMMSTPSFELAGKRSTPGLVFLAIFLISSLLAALLRLQRLRNEHTQKQLDAALRDNQALLSTLNMHAIVSVTDAQGNIIDVNDAFCRISGYQRSELIGKNHRICRSNAQSAQFWSNMWQSISTGTPWRGEVCNRKRDGSLYWVDTFIAPFKSSTGVIDKYIAIQNDISENRIAAERLQNALRDSNALLSTLNMHAIVSIADSTGRLIEVNQAYCHISGYTKEEILRDNHRIVATGIQSADFLSNMWRTIASGTPWRGEVCNRSKNGNVYWVDTFIAPFKDAQGRIEKFISIRTDITSSKKAASRLANQRSALAHIIEGTNVGTWEWNVESGEMRLNERWADQIGYELNQLTPSTIQTWDNLTHPDDLEKAKQRMKLHFQHDLPYYECETRLKHKDGQWIWVLTRGRIASFTPLGKPEWVSGTQMDINERKNAEAELQKSTQLLLNVRDQLTKAAEVAELGIWTWDLASDELNFNERMFDIYEVPEELRQEKLYVDFWRTKLHPDDLQANQARLTEAIHGGHSYNPIFRIISPTIGLRYIQAAGGVERDEHGQATLVTGINRDITLQYQAEEALRNAKQAADDANQAKSAFLANMSHEIRTPMNAILGMLSLLAKTPLSPQQTDYAMKTEGAARSLLNLLNDILDISKVEAGKMHLDPHAFRLDQLLTDIQDILTVNVGNKPVSIQIKVDPSIPPVLIGDTLRLRQVLTNLGSNAVKFTEQGSVTLSIKALALEEERVSLYFSVKDTGIGIARENHQKIFTGFTQAETSTTRRFGGTGLGIAISQGLLKMMESDLQLESELGKGACFYFTLNLAVANSSQIALSTKLEQHSSFKNSGENSDKNSTQRLTNLRLLLVEDNLNNQQVARELLESEGAKVQIANHGLEALEIIAAEDVSYDLILMDLQMPIMDGYTATQMIRQQLGNKKLPIIAMTANVMESDIIACQKAGIDDHVGKPFDINNLVKIILTHTKYSNAYVEPRQPEFEPSDPGLTLTARALGVDLHAALKRLGGRQDLYEHTLKLFIRDLAALPQQLQDAGTDLTTVLRHIHTVKGLAATLGALEFSNEMREIEEKLRVQKDRQKTDDLLTTLCSSASNMQQNLSLLAEALTKTIAQENERAQTSKTQMALERSDDINLFRNSLMALSEQLENADMIATETIVDLKHQFAAPLNEQLQDLESAIITLEFNHAQSLCQQLLEKIGD